MKKLLFLTTALILLALLGFSQKQKPLYSRHYTYKQITRRGYEVERFKGSIFITPKVYQNLMTNKRVK